MSLFWKISLEFLKCDPYFFWNLIIHDHGLMIPWIIWFLQARGTLSLCGHHRWYEEAWFIGHRFCLLDGSASPCRISYHQRCLVCVNLQRKHIFSTDVIFGCQYELTGRILIWLGEFDNQSCYRVSSKPNPIVVWIIEFTYRFRAITFSAKIEINTTSCTRQILYTFFFFCRSLT